MFGGSSMGGGMLSSFTSMLSQKGRDTAAYWADQDNSATAYARQKKLMGQQWGYNMNALEEAPSRHVAGLKKAGLNPILAAGAPQTPSVGAASAQQAKTTPTSAPISPTDLASAKLLFEQSETQKSMQKEIEARARVTDQAGDITEPFSKAIESSGAASSAKELGKAIETIKKNPGGELWDKNIPDKFMNWFQNNFTYDKKAIQKAKKYEKRKNYVERK